MDIDWVGIDSMTQLGADFDFTQSDHIKDMPLGLIMNSADFLKVDTHFQHFCFDSLNSEKIWWLFSLTASEVPEIVTFYFLSVGIGKLEGSEGKQKESLLDMT